MGFEPIETTIDPEAGPELDTVLEFADNGPLAEMCGEFDRNLAQIEQALDVQILRRGNQISLHGAVEDRSRCAALLQALYSRADAGRPLEPGDIDAAIRFGAEAEPETGRPDDQLEMFQRGALEIKTRKKVVEPRTEAQKDYVRALMCSELAFGIGPAGTGKTYLAVAVAANLFATGQVDRIILSRPAVEAGERLGFLPGDMKEKVDPYMQPLYDALNDFFPAKQLSKLMEDASIEIAPLAFMRGRTLANAAVVLDEAQNATAMQMKMFLTRLGEGSRMAITGDRSQVDLPRGVTSGLAEAERLLTGVEGITFSYFTAKDVVRHPLVAKIIEAYDHDIPPP